jgi:hypothetical protein
MVAWAAASMACGGNENACDFGQRDGCEGHSGLRYCQRDGSWSECVAYAECNPLTQEGCDDGLACYLEGTRPFCAAPETYPCEPGQFAGADECSAFCAHDGRDGYILDAPECEPGEKCGRTDVLPEGVGECGDFDEGI